MKLSHVDDQGRATMVDIGEKKMLTRTAIAEGRVFVSPHTIKVVRDSRLPKGNPFEIARVAGIQAAKETSRLIPLCHSLNLDFVDVEIETEEAAFFLRATARCRWATGVEMEALTAVSVAALTIYDMCKAVDKEMTVGEIRLVKKEKSEAPSRL